MAVSYETKMKDHLKAYENKIEALLEDMPKERRPHCGIGNTELTYDGNDQEQRQ